MVATGVKILAKHLIHGAVQMSAILQVAGPPSPSDTQPISEKPTSPAGADAASHHLHWRSAAATDTERSIYLCTEIRSHLDRARQHGSRVLEVWVDEALQNFTQPEVSPVFPPALRDIAHHYQAGHASLQFHLQAAAELLPALLELDSEQCSAFARELGELFGRKEALSKPLAQRLMNAHLDWSARQLIQMVDKELKSTLPYTLENKEILSERPEMLAHARQMVLHGIGDFNLKFKDLLATDSVRLVQSNQALMEKLRHLSCRVTSDYCGCFNQALGNWERALSDSLAGHANLHALLQHTNQILSGKEGAATDTSTLKTTGLDTVDAHLEHRHDGYYMVISSKGNAQGSAPAHISVWLDPSKADTRVGDPRWALDQFDSATKEFKKSRLFSQGAAIQGGFTIGVLERLGKITSMRNLAITDANLLGTTVDTALCENVTLLKCCITEDAGHRFTRSNVTLRGCETLSKHPPAVVPTPKEPPAPPPPAKGFFGRLRTIGTKVLSLFQSKPAEPPISPNEQRWDELLRSSLALEEKLKTERVEAPNQAPTTRYTFNLGHASVTLELRSGKQPTAKVTISQQTFGGFEQIPSPEHNYDGPMCDAVVGYIAEIVRLNQPRKGARIELREKLSNVAMRISSKM